MRLSLRNHIFGSDVKLTLYRLITNLPVKWELYAKRKLYRVKTIYAN